MWLCSCDENGTNVTDNHTILNPTTVGTDNECVRCGYYAVWNSKYQKHGDTLDKLCTVVKRNTEEFEIMTIREMTEKLSANSSNFRKRTQSLIPYRPTSGTHVVFFEVLDRIDEEHRPYIFDDIFYVYDLEGNMIFKDKDIKNVVKFTKDSKTSIISNMRGETIHTKNKYVYRKNNSNFNVKVYLDTLKQNIDLDYSWKYDVISYSDSEFKIVTEVDNYGTWKEKLYS